MYLGIDCGTQGAKVLIWNARTEQVVAASYHTYGLISDRPGQKEQHPAAWLDAIKSGIQTVIADAAISPTEIAAIGISGQQHGLVLLDEHDNLIRPAKLWCDTETVPELTAFLARFNAERGAPVHHFTGIHIPVAFTLAKLLWVQAHEPESYRRIAKLFLPHEYLNYWLTGHYCAEYGDASGTGWFDTFNRRWSKEVVDAIDPALLAKLPPLIEAHQPAGFLSASSAAILGLPQGIPVSSGGGDNMMSAIGTGNIEPGILTMSLGTSGTLFTHAPQQIETQPHPDINAFCSSSGGWLPLVSTMNVTNAINAFREVMDIPLAEFEHYLNSSEPGAGGLLCYPWLNGARLPNRPNATASLMGMTTGNFNKANLLRSAVEGVTFKLCKGIEIFQQCGLHFDQVRVIGGGANSRAWCQLIADISGIEVIRPAVSDAGALGAALQARWCVHNLQADGDPVALKDMMPASLREVGRDVISPHPQQREIYRPLYARYHDNMPLAT
ncbi:xylulokinase [Atlantibacter hermannii]|uniref:xylulokinase n=1 Tax=Atlantibacter hermannii TaxID=565 RepID=UPI0028A1F1FA|nr:xylulokinase [Atlantibacter hermannii]